MTNEKTYNAELAEVGNDTTVVPTPQLTHAAPVLKEGDVYRFRYSDEVRKQWRTDPNWCFDGQLEVKNGKLVDTYWRSSGDARVVKLTEGAFVFVCNLNDVREIRESETLQYDEADVFNLSYQHGCYRRFVVRKDAKPSAERMLEEVRKKQAEVRAEIDYAIRTLGDLDVMRHQLESGDLSRKPWWGR